MANGRQANGRQANSEFTQIDNEEVASDRSSGSSASTGLTHDRSRVAILAVS